MLKTLYRLIHSNGVDRTGEAAQKKEVKADSNSKRCVIHVGTDKTGSTAIQSMLSTNAEQLKANKCFYPLSGRGNFHHHGPLFDDLELGNYERWQHLYEELNDNPGLLGIISFEGFYHLPKSALDQIKALLPDFDITVVIYLRRQSDMVRSGLAQRIKQGTSRTLDIYAFDDLLAMARDYLGILENLEDVFGRENIIAKIYEQSAFKDGDIFVDFLSALGADVSIQRISEEFILPAKDPNPSLDVEAIYILNQFDKTKVEGRVRATIKDYLLWHGSNDKSTCISDRDAAAIDRCFRESNQKIARQWLGRKALFSEDSRFVFREPERSRLESYLDAIWGFIPFMSMLHWGGNKHTLKHFKHIGRLITDVDCREGLIVSREPVDMIVRIGGRKDIELTFFCESTTQIKFYAEANGSALDVEFGDNCLNMHIPYHVFLYCAGVLRLKLWCDCSDDDDFRLTEMAFSRL